MSHYASFVDRFFHSSLISSFSSVIVFKILIKVIQLRTVISLWLSRFLFSTFPNIVIVILVFQLLETIFSFIIIWKNFVDLL